MIKKFDWLTVFLIFLFATMFYISPFYFKASITGSNIIWLWLISAIVSLLYVAFYLIANISIIKNDSLYQNEKIITERKAEQLQGEQSITIKKLENKKARFEYECQQNEKQFYLKQLALIIDNYPDTGKKELLDKLFEKLTNTQQHV